ncbi:MAG: DNA mismatch repair endonuclease MutL [Ruminococcaceae bacterium]|nr:DNA mismatch repair endonuclease MutL [Oscillospiraceae bacterium]
MKINVLPQTIANMIAAGEVVERPASVVKELVENSIDAGAKNVTVEIKNGGMTYIRVTDDGSGIAPDEVETAFLRHATSKISTEEDLNAIYTLGFRGEALASIASVARVDIFTKTKDEDFGVCLSIEGGEVVSKDEAGCSDGTTMIVRDLFFNTPARMKFLKSDKTESGYVTDAVSKLILSHPEVKIKLISNGKEVSSSQGDSKLLSAIYSVYGKDFPRHMIPVDYSEDGITVTGYVGDSEVSRKDRRGQVFFINSRYITSKVISAALSEAFQNFVMVGKFPMAVLNIKVSGNFVDVNVHPTKIEVRFSDDKKVYQSVYWAVKNALTSKKHIPDVSFSKSEAQNKVREDAIKEKNKATQLDINLLRDSFYKSPQDMKNNFQEEKREEKKTQNPPSSANTDATPKNFSNPEEKFEDISDHIKNNVFFSGRIPGLLRNTPSEDEKREEKSINSAVPSSDTKETPSDFSKHDTSKEKIPAKKEDEDFAKIPSATPDADKKEETLQEKIQKEEQIPKRKIAGVDFFVIGQVFATYILVQMDNKLLIIDQHAAQERLYFEELLKDYESKEIYSQNLLIPETVDLDPVSFPLVWEKEEFFTSLGFELEKFGEKTVLIRSVPAILQDANIKDAFLEILSLLEKGYANITKTLLEDVLHTMSCKRAIKGNQILNQKEMESLSEKVISLDYINTCPHGRPICISMSEYEMEKQFKRV